MHEVKESSISVWDITLWEFTYFPPTSQQVHSSKNESLTPTNGAWDLQAGHNFQELQQRCGRPWNGRCEDTVAGYCKVKRNWTTQLSLASGGFSFFFFKKRIKTTTTTVALSSRCCVVQLVSRLINTTQHTCVCQYVNTHVIYTRCWKNTFCLAWRVQFT